MKKILILWTLFLVLAFWTTPVLAESIVYFAPDGSQITKAEYDRLIDSQAKVNQNLKTARSSKPAKKSSPLISATQPKTAPVRSSRPKLTAVAGRMASKISEADIHEILKNILHSTNNRKIEDLLQYLAPKYTATFRTEKEEMSLSRKEYKDYLEEGWSGYGFYRAQHENETIDISPDQQKATLETDVIEIASLTDGQTVKLRSRQKMMFEIIDGKILLTSTEATVDQL